MGFFRGVIDENGYRPPTIHKLLLPKISGNEINGLDEETFRRPTPIYHWFGKLKIPFNRVNIILFANDLFDRAAMGHIKKAGELQNAPAVPLAQQRVEKSPREWSSRIKEYALANGADVAGIVAMNQDWVFEGFEVGEKWIIMLGFKMNYEELEKLPDAAGGREVLRVYAHGQETASNLANWLRSQGWDARGYCGPMASEITMIPPAIAAGLGELGKHGSIINRELGSNMRLAYVLTDIPLQADQADDFGADDFCARCKVCEKACPPDAMIPEKQMVRGVRKWYVDFDKCLPYFNDHFGCGICLMVCPWSRPGIARNLVEKLARRKARKNPDLQ
jgi:Pyruvate/2-oxoacid:ferredoxin oxidoreductase delta subunit